MTLPGSDDLLNCLKHFVGGATDPPFGPSLENRGEGLLIGFLVEIRTDFVGIRVNNDRPLLEGDGRNSAKPSLMFIGISLLACPICNS